MLRSIQRMQEKQLLDRTHIRIRDQVFTLQQLRKFQVQSTSASPVVILNMCDTAQLWTN
jgi:hypothetical protein